MDLLNDEFPFAKTALSGKHALIFGASKGIGAATAKMMAMAGADVTLCARNEDSLVEIVSQINEFATGKISHAVIDLEELDAIDGLIENLLQNICKISGSDITDSNELKKLIKDGAKVYIGHYKENI